MLLDDLGAQVPLAGPARRVVSLVPSITEAIAASCPERLVGATDWCTHPADLDVIRVRGTKNPDRAAIAALSPDLVIANQEENRELDVRRLREAGIAVWVTVIETVPQALDSLDRLFDEALVCRPEWLTEARRLWGGPVPPARVRAAVPIWRDPWMVVGARNYTTDLLAHLGVRNVFGDNADRYPKTTVEEIEAASPDVVLLPDEPYVFTDADGPEAFARTPTRLVSGRLLTWYGPAMVEAHAALRDLH
ncbi:helical backbone metal receptor [Actinomycetota bacterium]